MNFSSKPTCTKAKSSFVQGSPRRKVPKCWSIRYSPEVVAAFKATGKGWQTRMDDALKEWLKEHSAA
ncbi:MAG: BrnA antitoxin family protein [Methylomonas sp.]|nr:BrnA antitoxin family protein [Methylomonas sp.]PPD19451.1 MAG: hypothetical protein CTY23_11800 [Methylomonas sp.]PPD24967.1 MAG: hypothetical protein CTY22_10040 [Methylomonas sp.]PPD34143.1 MAG: hypothetical protein CTY21_10020 [Methylomonas sp.]PPD38000.1 MAG: hypothetical protein CTY17_10120 [Methylomonas sp.]